ncbi:uncharacterized protein Z518_09881 [Rhinocladiella mackenziei CBS 650.93]|uniref:Rhinocladiella mackenziei CBS 650.93 unplaced genomic scaffold supercont1.8, whole genome shotgun sequence n=1 Tax=Rhinocladiella mackenziei CBS 650.93 TaxID=1442369 RepID=A0A0D2IC30_9EURO|nr:uncharacterized protein Z518_09881 [Rhinocladiella mackenziei CBS 650.93]KIX00816.1 hypothetical protein Z518_09881 [Rhinocladiella mackenziei CBS 650.93]
MSDSSTEMPVYGPRPFPLSENDRRGVVLTIGVLYIIYACMVLVMRLASKYRNIGLDDWLSVAATALAIPQFGAVIAATVNGSFGSSYNLLSSSDTETVARCIRASDVLFLLAIFVAKCSVVWLTRRLFAASQHQKRGLCEITIGLCAAWCLGSILAVTIGCNAESAIHSDTEGRCSGLDNRWTIVGVLDALLEILIWILSLVVLVPLQMSWKKKLQASASFILRLPIIVFIGLNIKYVSDLNSASDAGVALISPVLFRQTELLYALFSAAIPALNQYLRRFDTRNATQFGYRPDQYGSSGHNYEMSNLSNHRTATGGGNKTANNGIGNGNGSMAKSSGADFRPAGYAQYHARIDGPNLGKSNDGVFSALQEDGSVGRHGSEEHIIRKEMVYDVRCE